MADSNATRLIETGNMLFSSRWTLMSLWQEIANNFYVERADFTVHRIIGTTFAEQLMTSYPLVARRDLGNAVGSMLRPSEKEWFFMETSRQDQIDFAGKQWLEYATTVMRRSMYDRVTQFVRATKEADNDFIAFGQAVMSYEWSWEKVAMLYRTWHLRDVAWVEDKHGEVTEVHRKWKPYARDVVKMFKNASQAVRELADKDPFAEYELRHIVLLSEDYDGNGGHKMRRFRFTSVFVELGTQTILEEAGRRTLGYIVPRWETVSGSQYAYSPATVAALPDARLLQAITLTLIEAGERFTNPPMIATQEAIRSDVQLFAGGITWVDAEYDERLGDVLRPLTQDKSGLPIGDKMAADVVAALGKCFFLDRLTMSGIGERPGITAFEVGQRVQEYIRQALPLFEPMEQNYSGALCEGTFDTLLHAGAFGPMQTIPRSVLGAEVRFRFESPLTEIIDAQLATKLESAKQLVATLVDVAPSAPLSVDWEKGFRAAIQGSRLPVAWMRSSKQVAAIQQNQAQEAAQQKMMAGATASAGIVQKLGGLPAVQQALQGGVAPAAPGAGGA